MSALKDNWNYILLILVPILAILLWRGFQNKVDPDYVLMSNLSPDELMSLDKSVDSLQLLFETIQGKDYEDDSLALKLISKPFLPTMTFSKFNKYATYLKEDRFIVMSGIAGGGTTTLTSRLAAILGIEADRQMLIQCAPHFDLMFHEKYIGSMQGSHFRKGLLLQYWEKCLANPDKKFVTVIDNFDKINPETFFGPELWEGLNHKDEPLYLGDYKVVIPDNFFLISTTHNGVGAKVSLNNEHFDRIGRQYFVGPEESELFLYLSDRLDSRQKKLKADPQNASLQAEVAALADKRHLRDVIYFFKKANQYVATTYSKGHQIGQWSNVRKEYDKDNFQGMSDIFLKHVNSFSPAKEMNRQSIRKVYYSLANDGKLKGSSTINKNFQIFKEWGFFTEFVVALSFALFTAFFSWYYFKKRKALITGFLKEAESAYNDHLGRIITNEEAFSKLEEIKRSVDEHVVKGEIKYHEAVFFYNFITDRARTIETSRAIGRSFSTLVDVFLEDKILSKSEYRKLTKFLAEIEHTLPSEEYGRMKKEVERIHVEYGE